VAGFDLEAWRGGVLVVADIVVMLGARVL
jgi:hypothetical protein